MAATIVVIEDYAANMDLMCYMLQASGHRPLIAADGAAGLELVRSHRPDLVLCDMDLPDMDGHEILRALRADPAARSTLIVAVTSFATGGDRAAIHSSGFDGFLAKPIRPEQFASEVEKFLQLKLEGAARRRPVPPRRIGPIQGARAASLFNRKGS